MPGHNHYRYCTCGWCSKYRSAGRTPPLYSSATPALPFSYFDSFTIPNAICPVCGATVFFYQSSAGGRVFFDELGPPWPKHPCTDNPALPVSRPTELPAQSKTYPIWQRDGWEPIKIRSSRLETTWHVIPCINLTRSVHFDALADARLRVAGETRAFIRPWDKNGWSLISYVELDGSCQAAAIPVFQRKRYINTQRWTAVGDRKKVEHG